MPIIVGSTPVGALTPGPPSTQDIASVAGDDALLIITATDGAGDTVGLDGVTAITFSVQETLESTSVISKTMAAAQIALIDDGKGGQFSVTVAGTDTEPLAGYFLYQAKITNSAGYVYTVAAGALRIVRSVPA